MITYTNNTAEQDFLGNGADLVLPSLQYMTMSDLLSLSPPTPPPQQQHEDESEEEDDYEDPYQERFLYDYVDEEEGNGEDDDQEAEDGLKAKVKTELQRKGSS